MIFLFENNVHKRVDFKEKGRLMGYVVGNGGLLLRSTGDVFANSPTTGDSVIWVAQPTNDLIQYLLFR